MKQVNHARDIKTYLLGSNNSLYSLLSLYDAFRTANPSAIIPEGGLKVVNSVPAVVLNSARLIKTLTGATLAALETAYNDWKTANVAYIVLQESFSIDNTVGSVSYNMVVSYITASGSYSFSVNAGCIEYYINSETKQ